MSAGAVLSRVVDVRVPQGQLVAVVTFVCMPGEAPVISLLSERIDSNAWQTLKRQVDEAWRELAVWCMCEDPFWLHAASSPHGCQRKTCGCDRFRADADITRRIERP